MLSIIHGNYPPDIAAIRRLCDRDFLPETNADRYWYGWVHALDSVLEEWRAQHPSDNKHTESALYDLDEMVRRDKAEECKRIHKQKCADFIQTMAADYAKSVANQTAPETEKILCNWYYLEEAAALVAENARSAT
jgi:hypothetical protein